MATEQLIPINEFCIHHHIEVSFIYSLNDSGLIEITGMDENKFVSISQLNKLEQLIRLYQDLDINLAGIETVTYLLEQINGMQEKIRLLNNKLSLYEN